MRNSGGERPLALTTVVKRFDVVFLFNNGSGSRGAPAPHAEWNAQAAKAEEEQGRQQCCVGATARRMW